MAGWIISLVAAGAISLAAHRAGALNRSGALAATAVGGVITGAGGWSWGALLIAFFLSSSLLSRATDRRCPDQHRNVARGSNRDAWQVVANGGVAALCAVAYALTGEALLAAAFAASLATAAADTWATEIGAFSRRPPRLITTFAVVPRGVSGAVSPLGTFATLIGATAIALLTTLLIREPGVPGADLFLAVAIGGTAGSLLDSLLGATLQIRYRCPECNEITERTIHRCGAQTLRTGGHPVFTNDIVNLTAILAGTALGALLLTLFT